MPTLSTMLVFFGAALLLVLFPGPNVLFIVAQSLRRGRGAGIVASLGVEVGTWIHIVAAAFGLSALVVSSATAFSVVKYAGAAYLLYLGVRTLLARDDGATVAAPTPARSWQVFRQGVVVNVLNPKVALFFLAFLPQFVDPGRGSVALQILVLGGILATIGLVCDIVWAVLAGSAGGLLRGGRRRRMAERWISGSIYLGLGVTTALVGVDGDD